MADENVQEKDYRELSPEKLRKLLGCFVNVSLQEGDEINGWVYTIDPVSHTIVIAKEYEVINDEQNNDSRSLVFVLSKAVRKLQVVETTKEEPHWLKNFTLKKQHEYSDEQLQKRKTSLVEWLNKNRIPILNNSSDGAVYVVGGLVIEPPYNVDSCKGTNEIVLDRIRKFINAMPDT